MTNYNAVKVTDKEMLDKLYEDSALTIEGLSEESIPDFLDWINETAKTEDNVNVYITEGKVMNNVYGLTKDNAYPNECTIVSIMLSDIENANTLIMRRFEVGGRWFDDVVDNNLSREHREYMWGTM